MKLFDEFAYFEKKNPGLNRLGNPHKYKQWFEVLVCFKKKKKPLSSVHALQ